MRLNGPKAATKELELNFVLSDTDEKAHLFLSGGALHHRMGSSKNGIPTLSMTRSALDALNMKTSTIADLRKNGDLTIEGNPLKVKALFDLIEEPEYWFEIVRP